MNNKPFVNQTKVALTFMLGGWTGPPKVFQTLRVELSPIFGPEPHATGSFGNFDFNFSAPVQGPLSIWPSKKIPQVSGFVINSM